MAYISFQPKDYFNTVLHTGANKTVSVGFEPSFSWIKERDTAGHALFDAVRGATKLLESNDNAAENTQSTSLTAFTSDGFTLGADSGSYVGGSSQATVSWNWKANGAGSSNSNGSITSTVSVNTTAGFSIVKYTGTGSAATVGHGLGTTPDLIIIKNYSRAGEDWVVWHNSFAANQFIRLNTTATVATSTSMWNNTLPTSTVFSLVNEEKNNYSGDNIIAYCFAEKKGFSKISTFVGNGSSDGPFLYCGFKPAFIILKNINDGAKNWEMLDNKRPSTGQNPADDILFPDTADPEASSQTDRLVDFVSTGVKIRGNSAQMNGSGQTHLFMAFAEEPLVSSNGVPNTAK